MSETFIDRQAEIARIQATAEKIALRMNGRFVRDEKKLSSFVERPEQRAPLDGGSRKP